MGKAQKKRKQNFTPTADQTSKRSTSSRLSNTPVRDAVAASPKRASDCGGISRPSLAAKEAKRSINGGDETTARCCSGCCGASDATDELFASFPRNSRLTRGVDEAVGLGCACSGSETAVVKGTPTSREPGAGIVGDDPSAVPSDAGITTRISLVRSTCSYTSLGGTPPVCLAAASSAMRRIRLSTMRLDLRLAQQKMQVPTIMAATTATITIVITDRETELDGLNCSRV